MGAVNLTALQEKNEDVIGWISIPDTSLDYPLMQGILFVTTAIMTASIIVTDLICLILDPRQRKGEHYA